MLPARKSISRATTLATASSTAKTSMPLRTLVTSTVNTTVCYSGSSVRSRHSRAPRPLKLTSSISLDCFKPLRSRHMSGHAPQPPESKLPQLPPTPPYPCPFLTDEEIQTYLVPLYHRGWSVQPSTSAKKPAPELVKRFIFSEYASLELFERDLKDVTESENHHAVQELTDSPPSITIKVHTHSGLRPAAHPDEPRRGRVQPGITLRDVRFAYLLEERFVRYLRSGGEQEQANMRPAATVEEQPRTAEAVEARRVSSG
ncbi:hypothetical protein C8Q73DRAFT_672377 [Cubamyces lactineus]|nr:hypothetical protein C8Q73DRAFT_672377 [Cubamyces lactineus]